SFHRQIFPDEALSFGFSASAMHWLSAKPGLIADHVHAVGATEAESAGYRKQALSDWTDILLARARELVPGGRLVLVNFCVDECGRYLGSTAVANLLDTLAKHWRDLASAKIITEDEYRAGTIQQYYRTVDDFFAPFKDPHSPVSRAGLRLEHVSTMLTPCAYAARYRQKGDGGAYAQAYVPHFRAWSESTFVSALNRSRPKAERAAIINQFYRAYEADVAARPEAHWVDRVHCVQTIVKTSHVNARSELASERCLPLHGAEQAPLAFSWILCKPPDVRWRYGLGSTGTSSLGMSVGYLRTRVQTWTARPSAGPALRIAD